MSKKISGIDVATTFREILSSETSLATAIAAIRTLILVLEKCPARTLQVFHLQTHMIASQNLGRGKN
jgi:hypothetical protein